VGNSSVVLSLTDNGGRRSGTDRRGYTSTINILERRSGKDRRSGHDRRNDEALNNVIDFRRWTDRAENVEGLIAMQQSQRNARGLFLGISFGLLIWTLTIFFIYLIL